MDILEAVAEHGSINKAAAALGLSRFKAQTEVKKAKKAKAMEIPRLPSGDVPLDELISRRRTDFSRRQVAYQARNLVPVKVKDRKPIGLVFFGDLHLDDDGCDVGLAFDQGQIVADTEGMYGMPLGDITNNWVGRLARLYAHQSTTDAEAWRLAKAWLELVPMLALVNGNHDLWSGAANPINWILKDSSVVLGDFDVKLQLEFFNGRKCRVWMRHNFPGNSMWNTLHALMRAAQQGNDFHIFAAGHLHTGAHHDEYSMEMGHYWHALRASGYKVIDHYADELGCLKKPNYPSGTFIIDPNAKTEQGFIRFEQDLGEAAERLTWLRKRA